MDINQEYRDLKDPGDNGGRCGAGYLKSGRPQVSVNKQPITGGIYQGGGGNIKRNPGKSDFPKGSADCGGGGNGNQGKLGEPQIPGTDEDNLFLGGVPHGHHGDHLVRNEPAKDKVERRGGKAEYDLKTVGMLHSFGITGAVKLGQVDAAGTGNRVNDHQKYKVKLIGYINRSHANVPQACNHKVVDQRNHAHNKLLKHYRQGDTEGFTIKTKGAYFIF